MPSLVVAIASLGCSALVCAEDDHYSFHDWRASATISPSPDIEERVTSAGTGVETTYTWDDAKKYGAQGQVGWYGGNLQESGGLVCGGGIAVAAYDTTPASYTVNGAVFRPGGASLHARTAGINLAAGYGWVSDFDPTQLDAYLELTPFVGGGVAWADTENQNGGGTLDRESGLGWYYEVGARAGAYLTEDQFVVGIVGFYVYGSGQVDITMPNNDKSQLTLDRSGFGGGVEAGYRY